MTEATGRLVYDGDCGFCRYSVDYARRLTGERVEYVPYQQVGGDYPDITAEEFRRAIWWFGPDGECGHGAEAAFRTLATAPGRGAGLWWYRRVPGFAPVTEAAYRWVADHRPFCLNVARLLIGPQWHPPAYRQVRWLFMRLLALCYLLAFVSAALQITGLVGGDGILPVAYYLDRVDQQFGALRFWAVPTLFWLDAGDTALRAACFAGIGLSLLAFVGVFERAVLIALYVLYLSVVGAGQIFMQYQWDALLLEAGFLAMLMPRNGAVVVWLFRWLLFRLMLLSGAVKLLSGDPHWADLSALDYHFLTQPLPTPLAWYADHLPHWLLHAGVAATLFIELVLPWLIFLPRRPRFVAAGGFILLEGLIALTGNYNWFNLLTIGLCLFLLDDRALRFIVPARLGAHIDRRAGLPRLGWLTRPLLGAIAALLILAGGAQAWSIVTQRPLPAVARPVALALSPFEIANNYGVFAVMTTKRDEIIVEGSNDGSHWQPYRFRYKPGDLRRAPPWLPGYQARLDWQMWFAALGDYRDQPWFINFCARLLQGKAAVTALLAPDSPFTARPPRYVRALRYRYRFSEPTTRERTGQWWVRERIGVYMPALSLPEQPVTP